MEYLTLKLCPSINWSILFWTGCCVLMDYIDLQFVFSIIFILIIIMSLIFYFTELSIFSFLRTRWRLFYKARFWWSQTS